MYVFHRKDIVSLNLISRYMVLQLSSFWKAKTLWTSVFHSVLTLLFIQCNIGSCCMHVTGGVNIYLYMYVSVLVLVCLVCVCLCLWYQIKVLAEWCHSCRTFSKFDAFLHKTNSKVLLLLRYQDSAMLGP